VLLISVCGKEREIKKGCKEEGGIERQRERNRAKNIERDVLSLMS